MAVPRIAIVHTWTNTQNEGWFRIEFDRLQIPYSYISDHVIRDTPNLREKFDVIIFPPVGGSAQSIVNGTPMRGDPVPWKFSELTPNIGKIDSTDDIRPGMGWAGLANLQKFLREGGVLAIQGNYDESVSSGKADCGCGYTDPRDNEFAQLMYDYTLAHTSRGAA